MNNSLDKDVIFIKQAMTEVPDYSRVTEFIPGPGIHKLELNFDIEKLRLELKKLISKNKSKNHKNKNGFGVFSLTQRPGQKEWTENDLSGRYWIKGNEKYIEEAREKLVEEKQFSEFNPKLKGTYFEVVYSELIKRFPIGRMRILSKGVYNCNSWHRDPEPRIHIPIETNPGSLFIVNHHLTHLPADGSVYFTDTRGYHTAINGGEVTRTHIVAALAYEQIKK
jgi:hypothetical protein